MIGNQTMLEKIANQSRRNIIKMIYKAQSGHPGGSLSCIDLLTYLYQKEVKLTKENVHSNDRNKLILSKGHGAPALYASLQQLGLLSEEDLWTFRQIDSALQGHPNMNDVSGVDMSTGSLGQGISVAVGIALANKIQNKAYKTYVICGDGEFEEGQVYEALMAAGYYQLKDLIVLIDHNGLQIDGKLEDVMDPSPWIEKLQAFRFNTLEIDGHDFSEIEAAIEKAKESDRPTAIVAHTIKGKGVSFMENQAGWHGKAPNEQQLKQALLELGEI